jgi:hypothetical protein
MAERAGRKSYPVAVTFMSSMIWPEALRAVPVAHRRPDHHDQRATARAMIVQAWRGVVYCFCPREVQNERATECREPKLRMRNGLTSAHGYASAGRPMSGFSQQYISDLEKGQRDPTVVTVYELSLRLASTLSSS